MVAVPVRGGCEFLVVARLDCGDGGQAPQVEKSPQVLVADRVVRIAKGTLAAALIGLMRASGSQPDPLTSVPRTITDAQTAA